MNKELKISDKSPFEKIRKFDGQGRSYWTSRELCAALGYSTYQKFSVPLAKAMRSAEADGINVDEHFNLMVEMVGVGSGARRSVENYHLTREACIFIARQVYAKKKEVQAALEYFSSVSIDFDGAECDVNCQEVVSEMEKDKIRERNREHWKRLNDEASEFYKKKMRLLDEVEDFKADASFHGNKAPHHMMYKLGTLYSKDGCRGYEFLIEYDVYEPVVGIYYGCKGLILDGNDEDGEKMFNEEWKDIRYYVTAVLENTFPGKSFTHRFKPTNNANKPELFSQFTVLKLDEWGGIPMDHPGTCESYLRNYFVGPLQIPEDRYIAFQSDPENPEAECERIQQILDQKGPIDICILGIGMNGHIALNEPAPSLHTNCHVAHLSQKSLQHPMIAGDTEKPGYGLTLGMANIFQSRLIILLINGIKKREITQAFLEQKISTELPASLLWLHPNVICLIDREAAHSSN